MKTTICGVMFCVISSLTLACGGAGGGSGAKIDIKVAGKDIGLAVKASGSDLGVKTFTDTAGKMTTATTFYAAMANFDMDTTSVATMKKPLTAPEQARVTIQLVGEEGTDQKADLKPGTYKADPKAKFMSINLLMVSTFADGKETNTSFDANSSSSKITGEVTVTSFTVDSVSGNIDVTDGVNTVKGAFTAKRGKK